MSSSKVFAAIYDENNCFWLRTTEMKITDDDPYTDGVCDVVNLASYYKKTTLELIDEGHSTISIEIVFEGKEKDDGYQEIYIFDYPEDKSSALDKKEIELTPNKRQTTYSTERLYFTLELTKIHNDAVFIRWGAHGEKNDDWYCRNVRVYFEKI